MIGNAVSVLLAVFVSVYVVEASLIPYQNGVSNLCTTNKCTGSMNDLKGRYYGHKTDGSWYACHCWDLDIVFDLIGGLLDTDCYDCGCDDDACSHGRKCDHYKTTPNPLEVGRFQCFSDLIGSLVDTRLIVAVTERGVAVGVCKGDDAVLQIVIYLKTATYDAGACDELEQQCKAQGYDTSKLRQIRQDETCNYDRP